MNDEFSVKILEADLSLLDHQEATVGMMDAYARDSFGDGKPLSEEVKRSLIPGLRSHPTTLVFLVYSRGTPVGIAVCFRGFSTFAAKPLMNISDYYVVPAMRGRKIGLRLLEAIESKASAIGCCKLTLEVQENNHRARHVYTKMGFGQAVYVKEAGGSLYMTKPLEQ